MPIHLALPFYPWSGSGVTPRFRRWFWRMMLAAGLAAGVALPGCGGSSAAPVSAAEDAARTRLPIAAITAERPRDAEASTQSATQTATHSAGAPAAILATAQRLRDAPYPAVTTPEQLSAAQVSRQRQLVEMATEVLAATKDRPAQQAEFDAAVTLLNDARLSLANAGDRASVDALYADAATLYGHDPTSHAAAEAAYTVARFAHAGATREGTPQWLEEYGRQARLFASHFPAESTRAAALLLSAGWSCDLHGVTGAAEQCYRVLVRDFGRTPQAAQAAGSLRRLKLVGSPLQLAGPTLDGGFVSVDDFPNRAVLIVFWTAGEKAQAAFSAIDALTARYSDRLAVIGVALDEDEGIVRSAAAGAPFPHIFFADPAQRGWQHPVADYYGVRSVPSIWLVGPEGTVRSTTLEAATVAAVVEETLVPSRQ